MFKRDHYLNKLIEFQDSEFVKVITGVRRSGKSFLLTQFYQHLERSGHGERVIFLNFEHPDTFPLHQADALYAYIKENLGDRRQDERIYFLFDEIQEVDGWQKLINGLRVAYHCDIYITGSNANLLSGELATYLSGRFVEIHVFPFSFSELLLLHHAEHPRDKQALFEDYMQYGGFPPVALLENDALKQDVLKGIYDSIILKDVSLRGQVANINVLLKIASYLMDNVGNIVSTNRMVKYLNATGSKTSFDTVDKYLRLLENAYAFYHVVRYDIRGKERLKTNGKYYSVDPGLRNSVIGRPDTNLGSQIENMVFLKLLQSGYQVFVGKYDEREIDFVCFKNRDVKYVQVAYQIPSGSDRELQNLLLVRDNYERIIVTLDFAAVGTREGVSIIHLFDFLEQTL